MTAEERESLILAHMNQVRAIARRIHERVPPEVSLDDMISAGVLGLISAIDNFDEAQNVKLRTYAELKIRGAILDSLRGMDWAPRHRRRKSKAIDAAVSNAEKKLNRPPTEDEIATELKISVREYHEWLVDVQSVDFVSFGAETDANVDSISGSDEMLPLRILERAELGRLLAEAIESVPQSEKTVLSLYFQHEMAPGEIAQIMNLRPPRVSQLKAQGLARLRVYLERRLAPAGVGGHL